MTHGPGETPLTLMFAQSLWWLPLGRIIPAAMVFLLACTSPRLAQAVDARLLYDTFVNNSLREPAPPIGTHYLTINAQHSAYLHFDFKPVLPANTSADQIERAILEIYVAFNYVRRDPPPTIHSPPPVGRGVAIFGLLGGFREDYRQEPMPRDTVATVQAPVPRQGNFLELDITPLVRAWVSKARQNYGLAIVGDPAATGYEAAPDIRIPSKENPTNARQARLQVMLRPAGATP